MSTFDLISDIHLDFWVNRTWNWIQERKRIQDFIEQLLPDNRSHTLVIAGDLGHYNQQNYKLLKALTEYYKHIIIVPGNHDYYLLTPSIQYKYAYNSLLRWQELKQLTRKQLPSITFLDGDITQIEGIAFGGCGMWYDFQYGIQILNQHYNRILEHWKINCNDAKWLKGTPRITRDMFAAERKKLDRILVQSDVIITHFSPDWSRAPDNRKLSLSTSYYYFDGAPILPLVSNKIWCFGHVHQRMDYQYHNCRFINASLGYPSENHNQPKHIVTVLL
ncbi:3',5'-cyclic adenosine monophosphate phosphodiesterase CpdA [compost metagenome]